MDKVGGVGASACEIEAALTDALEACESLRDGFQCRAADAFFASHDSFVKSVAQSALKAARAMGDME